MEIPIKLIAIIIIAVVVLTVVILTLFTGTAPNIDRAEAERVFGQYCLAYSKSNCDWSVTYTPSFSEYLNACRVLHGDYREAFSCLYTLCNYCYETSDLKCSGLCRICEGHEDASIDRDTCCLRYQSECSGSSVDCSKTCP